MKKIILLIAVSINTIIFTQTKGKYDLELYQKRLSITPRAEFGIFSELAPLNLGVDANYFLSNNILLSTSLGNGKENNKLELGGTFLIQNKVISKRAKVFDKTISSTSTSETYQVLLTDVNFIKMKGLRGGIYRRNFDASAFDIADLGYGESEITKTLNNVETKYKLGDEIFGLNQISNFSYSNLGMYAGVYLFSSRNSVNSSLQTGLSAKGRKNQSVSCSADVLLGGGNIRIPKTYSGYELDSKSEGSPIGLRLLAEFSLYVGKNQNIGLMTNFEFGKYPKTTGMVGLLSFGLKVNLLDKIVSN